MSFIYFVLLSLKCCSNANWQHSHKRKREILCSVNGCVIVRVCAYDALPKIQLVSSSYLKSIEKEMAECSKTARAVFLKLAFTSLLYQGFADSICSGKLAATNLGAMSNLSRSLQLLPGYKSVQMLLYMKWFGGFCSNLFG